MEKPWVYGELLKIRKKLGRKKFPLIDQTYYPNYKDMTISPDMPCVIKIGPHHAGYGKIKISDGRGFQDIKSVVALHGDYCTAEPFIEWDYDIRIQKIGNHYRGFKRVSSNWKGNVGNESQNEDMELTEEFMIWIKE